MPIWAPPGYYTMRVTGWAGGTGQGYIFQNETYVMFDTKQLSIFTVMSKTVYHQEQIGISERLCTITALDSVHLFILFLFLFTCVQ